MTWFPFYLLALVVLRLFATTRDRKALSILLVAGFGSTLLAHTVMPEIHASWKLVIPGAVETLTIWALVTFCAPNRHTLIQVILLLIAWWCHLQCYADIQFNTNLVYDHYEHILAGVAIAQLLGFYDSFLHACRVIQKWCYLWATGGRVVSPASSGFAVVHNQDSTPQTKAP